MDARRLIEQAPQGLDILKELEAEFAERSREIKGNQDALRAAKAEFEKEGVLLTGDEAREKAAELQAEERQLARAGRELQEDITRRRDQRLGKLEKVITEVIIEVAKREKLDAVFQQAVYTSPDIDITDLVLAELKTRYEAKE